MDPQPNHEKPDKSKLKYTLQNDQNSSKVSKTYQAEIKNYHR